MTAGTKYGHGDLEASLVLVFPLLLAYQVGVLFAGHVNGADVVTRALYAALGSRAAYLVLHAIVAALFLLWIRRTRRWHVLSVEVAAPVVLEAAIYGMTLAFLCGRLLGLIGLGVDGNSIVNALGAGVHEELVFRLGLMCALISMLRGGRGAVGVGLVVSALLFAGAHHLGGHGEPFTVHAFVFRTLAGCAFGAIFWFRSLAHAVYAHTIYDLLVALT